jgi:hypothetical protein
VSTPITASKVRLYWKTLAPEASVVGTVFSLSGLTEIDARGTRCACPAGILVGVPQMDSCSSFNPFFSFDGAEGTAARATTVSVVFGQCRIQLTPTVMHLNWCWVLLRGGRHVQRKVN